MKPAMKCHSISISKHAGSLSHSKRYAIGKGKRKRAEDSPRYVYYVQIFHRSEKWGARYKITERRRFWDWNRIFVVGHRIRNCSYSRAGPWTVKWWGFARVLTLRFLLIYCDGEGSWKRRWVDSERGASRTHCWSTRNSTTIDRCLLSHMR
jgi:hypothetical protein